MKKLLTLSAFVFLCVTLSRAQTPTPLGTADFPHPGDSSDVKEYTVPQTQSYPDATPSNDSLTLDRTLEKALQTINDTYMDDIANGGNQTDTVPVVIYSQLPGANAFHRVYGTVNSFIPGATSFPAATTFTYMETTDGPAYVFYENASGGFYELGSYLMPSGQPAVTMVNSPKKPVANFPVDYNTPANVPLMTITSNMSTISVVTHYEAEVDAYGTLVVVSGSISSPVFTTYNNYLRVVQHSVDTMDLGSGMHFFIESKFYNYYVPGQFDPIIVYSVAKLRSDIDPMMWSMAGQWEDEIEVQYNKEFIPTGITEAAWELNLFPNPSDGMFSLNMPAFASDEVKAEVYDISGKMVRSEVYSNGMIQLDLTDQAEGMYTLRLSANGSVMTSKLVITR